MAAGNRASEVFPVGGPALAFPVEKIDTEAARKALDVLRDRPQVILAVIMLAASLMLNFVQVNGASGTPAWKSTAIGIPGKVATIRAAASDSIKAASAALSDSGGSNIYGALAAMSMAGDNATPEAAKARLEEAKEALNLSQLVAVIFLIPAGAAAILFFEARQARNRLVELGAGAIGILCVGATFYAREAAAQYVTKMVGTGAESFKQAFQIGLGGWLIAACSVGLVATALGYLRKTPGIPG